MVVECLVQIGPIGPNLFPRTSEHIWKKQRSPNSMRVGCLVPIGPIGPNLPSRSSESIAKNKGLRTSWGWVSGPDRPHRFQSPITKFWKYCKKKGLRTSWGLGVWSQIGPIDPNLSPRSPENIEKKRSPNFMRLGAWSQSAQYVPICTREVRKAWQKARVSELHGAWVSGHNRSHRSQSVFTKFEKYAETHGSPNFMGAGCLVPIVPIGPNLYSRSS